MPSGPFFIFRPVWILELITDFLTAERYESGNVADEPPMQIHY